MERRITPRVSAPLLLNAWEDGLPALCELEDASETGLLLRRLSTPRRVSSPGLVLEMSVDDGSILRLQAQRIREAGRSFAVRFAGLSADEMRSLKRWLRTQEAQSSGTH